ncbi:MAG: biotin/lipoyl-containing protein [Akkermansia sp.]
MSIEIVMPRLSDTMTEGHVLRWLKKVGDEIIAGDHIADLETDKANLELRVCDAGKLSRVIASEGATIAVGQTLALLEPIEANAQNDVRMSPLAQKIVADLGIDCTEIKGSGPYGRIMSCDLINTPTGKHCPIVKKAAGDRKVTNTVSCMDGYYVFSFDTDMSQLAAMSIPIAVQCEALLGGRYCLFDYVVRSTVKACLSDARWLGKDKEVDLLMVMDKGEQSIPIPDAEKKSIYDIACRRRSFERGTQENLSDIQPNLVICDAKVSVKELKKTLSNRPTALIALGGARPKTSIEVGRPVSKILLPVNLYMNAEAMDEAAAHQIVAEFKTLMENPVLLLF